MRLVGLVLLGVVCCSGAPSEPAAVPGVSEPHAPRSAPDTVDAAPRETPDAGAAEAAASPSEAGAFEEASVFDGSEAPPRTILADALPAFAGARRTLPDSFFVQGGRHGRRGRPYHAASRVVVDVPEAAGAGAIESLQRTARDVGYWPFRRCYEEGLRREAHLHGTVVLRLHIAPEGRVTRVQIEPDGLPAAGGGRIESMQDPVLAESAVSACVAREAAGIPFDPEGGDTDAILAVVLTPGDRALPVAASLLEARAIRGTLRSSWPQVRRCYAEGLARSAWLGGPLELRFRVGDGGAVTDVAEAGTHFADPAVSLCVVSAYRDAGLAFAGTPSTFFYALDLEPDLRSSAPAPP